MKIKLSDIENRLAHQYVSFISFLDGEDVWIDTLLTDSRNLYRPKSTLFFAIRTPGGNDGHKYILSLYENGVRNFVVEEYPKELRDKRDVNVIVSDRVIDILSKIGGRGRANAKEIVAITGSRGKTAVKELIFQLLEPLKKISRSPRSYNSKIGVPLSLWEIQPGSDLALIEAGVSKRNEMSNLRYCILPQTVIFTNVGDAHSEGFRSLAEKAEEKVKLADVSSVKTVIYNGDDLLLSEAVKKLPESLKKLSWSFKKPAADLFLSVTDSDIKGQKSLTYHLKGKEYKVDVPFNKDFDLENAAAAILFLIHEGIEPEIISHRFRNVYKTGTRLNVSDGINGCSIILDSYTSDYSSLPPAIDFMRRRKTPHQSLTLIMSDISHETESLDKAYRKIAQIISEAGIDKFIGIGEEFCKRKELFNPGSHFYESTSEFLNEVSAGDFIDELILLKGAPQFHFREILRQLETKNHETVLEVNLDSIVSNYNYFKSHLPSETGIVAMVKASGYGAGSYEIAKTLQDCGASYLAVAVLDEGIELRRKGITMPVMVMNPKTANYKAMFVNRLEPEIYSLAMLRDVIYEAERNQMQQYPIHIKLDTGMHRTGFLSEELPQIIRLLSDTNSVKIASVFSHLATSDCPDMDDYTFLQLDRFKDMTDLLREKISYDFKRHILNSAGILRFPEYHYEMVRLGIGLYGANTLPPEFEKPLAVVSTLRTIIISIREWKKGETIGYGRKGVLERDSRIATIPIGYADGLDRHFGNGHISVLVNGKEAPTIGNICMDTAMIDVTGIDCKEGDHVEIFGENIPLQRLADTLDTIPYEILTSVSPRVKRIYYRE